MPTFTPVDDPAARPIASWIKGAVSGTIYTLPDIPCTSIILTAHPSNVGTVWVAGSGTTGFPLTAGGFGLPLSAVNNLNLLAARFDVANDKLCYIVEQLI